MQNLTAKFVFLAYVASVTLAQGLHGLSGCSHGHAHGTVAHSHADHVHHDHDHGHHHHHDHEHQHVAQSPRTLVPGELVLRGESHDFHDCAICHFLQQNLTCSAAAHTAVAQDVASSPEPTLPASPQLAIFSPASPRAPPVV